MYVVEMEDASKQVDGRRKYRMVFEQMKWLEWIIKFDLQLLRECRMHVFRC